MGPSSRTTGDEIDHVDEEDGDEEEGVDVAGVKNL